MMIQHNMSAANANRILGGITKSLSSSTEKLSSGYRINRAADDAAGLSISEKMRGQIRGLNQASSNAQDGISLIQTAEGALSETHAILQRMRELAVQASTGTQTDDDRQAVSDEIKQLQEEITRISTDTEFNTMKLLDGSQSGNASSTSSGPLFGTIGGAGSGLEGALITSNIKDVSVKIAAETTTVVGQETAIWSSDGKTLTFNLVEDKVYTQAQIDDLIKNAKQEDSAASGVPATVTITLANGTVTAKDTEVGSEAKTTAGIKAASNVGTMTVGDAATGFVGASGIQFTSNKYGTEFNDTKFDIKFDVASGKEEVVANTAIAITNTNVVSEGVYTIRLAAGKEYTAEDIQNILKSAGFDFTVTLSGANPDEPNTVFANTAAATTSVTMGAGGGGTDGAGLGSAAALWSQDGYESVSAAKGITLQIGANEGQTMSFSIKDMSARALGVDANKVSLDTQESAMNAITSIDDAIKAVSQERSNMGAIQNRLDHTISNLDTSAENLQTAEARIRDLDMAKEMVEFSKNNILQQAAQSMLAQANQSTQGILSLLR